MEDGIVVFVSKGPVIEDIQEPTEYRVAYVEDVPALYDGYEEYGEPYFNAPYILDNFCAMDIYTNPDDAFAYADSINARMGRDLSYGVFLMKDFANIEFASY